MASEVFYVRFGDSESEKTICEKARRLFRESALGAAVVPDRFTAVKTHFGEEGNASYVPPALVKTVVDEVRKANGKPVLVETSTLYGGRRHNAVDHFNLAVEHGFGPEAMGCPLVFLDGLRGNLHVEEEVGLKHCATVAVAGDLVHIPSAVIVTHLTGHMLSGLGGAIKNVAMGLSSRAGKLRQHSDGRPRIQKAKCTACGTCARWCPEEAIAVGDKAEIDYARCIGCGECLAVCPADAVGFSWDASPLAFNEKMAEYASGILRAKRTCFITFIYRTTKDCNCMGSKGKVVCRDLGILASSDVVAVDQAAVDLVNEASQRDLFEEMWPGKHYTAQLAYAEKIGLGSRGYDLLTI